MRDFQRELSIASKWAGSCPASPPSWSVSAHALFKRCQRAYFFNAHMSQGGWDPYADPLVRECYVEKRLQTLPEWIDSCIEESLAYAFEPCLRTPPAQRRPSLAGALSLKLSRLLLEAEAQLRLEEWRSDPKKLNLAETYYQDMQPAKLIAQARDSLVGFSKSLLGLEEFIGIVAGMDAVSWRRGERFASFKRHGTTVWTALPGFAWSARGAMNYLQPRISPPCMEASSMHASALALLQEEFGRAEKYARLSIAWKDGEDILLEELSQDTESLSNDIKEGAAGMLSKVASDGMVAIDDFPKTEKPDIHCQACKFRGICARLT